MTNRPSFDDILNGEDESFEDGINAILDDNDSFRDRCLERLVVPDLDDVDLDDEDSDYS